MSISEKKFVLTHVIQNVSDTTEIRRFSTSVTHFDLPWKLGFDHTNGNFNFYLWCEKLRTEGTWKVDTKFEMKIISVKGKSKANTRNFIFGNSSVYDGAGFLPFTRFEELNREYVVDDKLIIEAHVTINEIEGIEKPKKLRNFDEAIKDFSNLVLKVGDVKFHVLKEFLGLQSSYFKSLLFGDFNESKQSEVTLKGIDPELFQCFLELLYLDPSLTDSNVEGVLNLVDMYGAENALRLCEYFLVLKSNHSLKTKLRIAARYKMELLKKHCFDNMNSSADVRSVLGLDLAELDPTICHELAEKALSF